MDEDNKEYIELQDAYENANKIWLNINSWEVQFNKPKSEGQDLNSSPID